MAIELKRTGPTQEGKFIRNITWLGEITWNVQHVLSVIATAAVCLAPGAF
jgi:hypothetical protein